MADYREISQSYAQGAIKIVIILNSGAVLACLTQIEFLVELQGSKALGIAFLIWLFGIGLGGLSWVFGFYSTRYVDIAERANRTQYKTANFFMHLASGAVLLSLLSFLCATGYLAIMFVLASEG